MKSIKRYKFEGPREISVGGDWTRYGDYLVKRESQQAAYEEITGIDWDVPSEDLDTVENKGGAHAGTKEE